ncbi:MAG: PAS domain S-box protein, partial [Desulfobacterales bacterium]|nr:PAS domain S-box protein [Desulfobacterales bacterium]
NQGARNNIGYSMDELCEMTPLDIEPEYTEETFKQMLRPLLSGTRNAIRLKMQHRRRDGSRYKTAAHLQPMRFQDVTVVVAIILDITEQEAAREKLLASVAEKEVLLKEIHHRVKNNMQIIQSLLNLQTGKTDNTLLKTALQDAIQRIKSMALIHETLYQSDDLALLDLDIYFQSIITYLATIYRTPDTRVEIRTDIQPLKLDIDRSISCGLILNELVSNAFKYAFQHTDQGRISIKFKARQNGTAQLMVSDNGCGLPAETKPEGSLGLDLVTMLARDQLEGELTVSRGANLGFTIEFPLSNED